MKYILLKLKVVNGEYSHIITSVHQLEKSKHKNTFAKKYASEFYGTPDKSNDKGVFNFFNGEIAVLVYSCQYINNVEYEILNKYI